MMVQCDIQQHTSATHSVGCVCVAVLVYAAVGGVVGFVLASAITAWTGGVFSLFDAIVRAAVPAIGMGLVPVFSNWSGRIPLLRRNGAEIRRRRDELRDERDRILRDAKTRAAADQVDIED
ncbi:MAG: hypothetical protein EA378_01365 [Phycisphaerales bacterium]|nr:MAG: hypothetical protein EA378_01365 [Phycisphaerales bacterium]